MAWLSGWSYRKEITITGQSGAGTNYQVDFSIGDSAGGDFHLEGHCTNFPQDIEVTDNDGTTLLDFWIEDITADPLKMWVEVADDLGSNQDIYVYYGKSGETTDSDIVTTMLFGDDFDTLNLTTKWNKVLTGDASVSNSILTLETDTVNIISKSYQMSDGILECRTKGTVTTISARAALNNARIYEQSSVQYLHDYTGGGAFAHMIYTDGVNRASSEWAMTASTWYKHKTTFSGVDITFKTFSDSDVQQSTISYTDTGGLTSGYIGLESYSTRVTDYDWIFVRKYVATEPAFSSAGSEETPPTGATIPVFNHLYNQMRA